MTDKEESKNQPKTNNDEKFVEWLSKNGAQKRLINKIIDGGITEMATLQKIGDIHAAMSSLKLDEIEKAIFRNIMDKVSMNKNELIPRIISISNNNNGSITIQWKFTQNENKNNYLKIEWAEDEKELDVNCINSKIIKYDEEKIDMDKLQETIVNIDNIKRFSSLFFRCSRINYFDIKSIELEKPLNDSWDNNHKGDLIEVHGNIIKGPIGQEKWNSVYGTKVCESPNIYHWKLKIKSYNPYFMIGVIKVSDNNRIGSCPDNNCPGVLYQYAAAAQIYGTQFGKLTLEKGCERFKKNGDILDMYLDLNKNELRYSTNGEDIDFTVKMPKEKYTLIAALGYKMKEVELVSSHYKALS